MYSATVIGSRKHQWLCATSVAFYYQQDIPVYTWKNPDIVTVNWYSWLRLSVRMKAVAGIQTKLRVAYQFKTAAHYPYSSTALLSRTAQQEWYHEWKQGRWRLIWHMMMELSFRMIVAVITENPSLVTMFLCVYTVGKGPLGNALYCCLFPCKPHFLVHYCLSTTLCNFMLFVSPALPL